MKNLFAVILFLIISGVVSAQIQDSSNVMLSGDSLSVAAPADSTTVQDSTAKKNIDIDAVVYASATDSLSFDVKNKMMYIFGSGEMKYKQSDLQSGKINVDFENNTLDAFGIPDTSDPTGGKYIQTPVLSERGETYEGHSIKYNFKTQRGFISLAKNRAEDSRYEGKKVKKVDKNVYFIEDGLYTTCDSTNPHTHFEASEMKVIQGDKIIAKWIFMYIGGVPLPIPIPFGVFPNESGRRSGIIVPVYGYSKTQGQYFRNFGYFFALSDYVDLALTGDYYMQGGWGARSRVRYAKRYDFNGNINAGYSHLTVNEEGDPDRTEQTDWNLSIIHSQQFNPTMSLNVNLQFQSSSYVRNNSTNYNDLLTQNIVSNATFTKRWDESRTSLTLNYSRTQNLDNGSISEILPSVSFSMPTSYPFESETSSSRDKKWYEYIGYSYSGQFKRSRNKDDTGSVTSKMGAQHAISASASPKIGYFNISPRLNYKEKWYDKHIKREMVSKDSVNSATGETVYYNELEESEVKELGFVRTFDFSLSASTKLYGIWNANTLGIEAFRHTITPSISYNYTPDFTKDKWGYYDSYVNEDGEIVRYDKYGQGIFGGVSGGESQRINMSIGNVFELKTMKDMTDTTSQAKKIQLLNLTMGTSYNFASDSLKLGDLSLTYRTQIGELLNLYGSSSFTFYDYVNKKKVDQFLVSKGKGLFRMNSFSLSASTTLSGNEIEGEKRRGEENEVDEEYNAFKKTDYIALYDEQPPDFAIPWNLSLSYAYNLSKETPDTHNISSSMSLNLTFSLTKNWKFTTRGGYDFMSKKITAPQITVYRDLHCWEMNFTWNPMGTYSGFFFEIRMKAPELRDIKVTKSKGLYSGRL